jgi:phosphopantetheinyl transferase
MGEAARQRWAVVASHWSPPPRAFEYLLSLLPAEEREQCNRFRQAEDRKRALVSRLLARAAAAAALRLQPFSAEAPVGWARTRGGKPYVASPLPRPPHAPNWNYSVSHEVRGWWLKRRCRCHTLAIDMPPDTLLLRQTRQAACAVALTPSPPQLTLITCRGTT